VAQKPVESKSEESENTNNLRADAADAESDSGSSNRQPVEGSLPFWRVMFSVIQAAFGVQNQQNKERDFAEGKVFPFIVAAILFTVIFVGVLLLIVSLVI
jgi:hypothetical protein